MPLAARRCSTTDTDWQIVSRAEPVPPLISDIMGDCVGETVSSFSLTCGVHVDWDRSLHVIWSIQSGADSRWAEWFMKPLMVFVLWRCSHGWLPGDGQSHQISVLLGQQQPERAIKSIHPLSSHRSITFQTQDRQIVIQSVSEAHRTKTLFLSKPIKGNWPNAMDVK